MTGCKDPVEVFIGRYRAEHDGFLPTLRVIMEACHVTQNRAYGVRRRIEAGLPESERMVVDMHGAVQPVSGAGSLAVPGHTHRGIGNVQESTGVNITPLMRRFWGIV